MLRMTEVTRNRVQGARGKPLVGEVTGDEQRRAEGRRARCQVPRSGTKCRVAIAQVPSSKAYVRRACCQVEADRNAPDTLFWVLWRLALPSGRFTNFGMAGVSRPPVERTFEFAKRVRRFVTRVPRTIANIE